jgi:MarR family transcriptional regulator, organic hydroperoxide resistance regulator
MDYSKKMRGSAIGARLRRLSEAIDRDASRAYSIVGIEFEQRWFGVLNQLALNGPMTVSELAAALRITRASVSQTRESLEKARIVETEEHPLDARQRHLVVTTLGKKLIRRLTPLWHAMEEAAQEINAEAGDAVGALDRLDEALARESLFERIVANLSHAKPDRRAQRAKS